MILSLDEFTLQYRDAFEDTFRQLQKEYVEFLDQLYVPTDNIKDKLVLACNPVLTNNLYQTSLYETFCLLWTVCGVLMDDRNITGIGVATPFQRSLLAQILKARGARQVDIRCDTSAGAEWIREKLMMTKGFVRFVYKCFVSLSFASSRRRAAIDYKRSYLLCDQYVLSSQISNKQFTNRYYPAEILEEIKKKHPGAEVLFFPELSHGFFTKENFEVLGSASEKFLYKHDYLKLTDYLSVFCLLFRKHPAFANARFKGVDLRKFVKQQCSGKRIRYYPAIESYYAVKRLKEAGLQITAYIDWWENQILDRVIHFALTTYYPGTQRSGFVNYLVDLDYNYYLLPTRWQQSMSFTPDDFLVTSDFFAERVSQFGGDFSFTKCLYNRFNIVERSSTNTVNCMLVVLPIVSSESLYILQTLSEFTASEKNNLEIVIKPHPADQNFPEFGELFSKSNVQITNESLQQLYAKASVVVSSTSSACVEALINEIPLIILSNSPYIQNPVPYIEGNKMYRKINDISTFKTAVHEYVNSGFTFDKTISYRLRKLLIE